MKFALLLALMASLSLRSASIRPFPAAPVSCKTVDGKDRTYPCEFQIVAIYLQGKNGELLGTLTSGNSSIKLPRSKAVSSTQQANTESVFYNASLAFRRVNPASFLPKPVPKVLPSLGFYTISTATVDYPLTTKELTLIKQINVGPAMPSRFVRPNQVAFTLRFTYTTGSGGSLIAPVKYVQLANPITFAKFPASVMQCRDRAEAFLAFNVSVDPAQ